MHGKSFTGQEVRGIIAMLSASLPKRAPVEASPSEVAKNHPLSYGVTAGTVDPVAFAEAKANVAWYVKNIEPILQIVWSRNRMKKIQIEEAELNLIAERFGQLGLTFNVPARPKKTCNARASPAP